MIDQPWWSVEHVTGFILVLGSVAALPGLLMFWIRGGQRGGPPRSRAHYVWERSFIMAAVVLTAIGFVLLEGFLQNTGGYALATIGATAYLFGGVLIVAAEALSLTWDYKKVYGLAVIYVVLAFLGQAAIGGALLQAGVVAAWIGWGTVLWNTACLIVLSVIARRDLYFPVLHLLAPLVIGLALLGGVP